MDTRYIYAGTRAKTLENSLLSETQMERLLTAKSVPEAFKALQDTFLAPYLAKHEKTDISSVLDQNIVSAKKLLNFIAPEPHILDILWLKYDFHNIKTIIKGRIVEMSDDEIRSNCFNVGKFEIDRLMKAFDEKKLGLLNARLETARAEAQQYKEISDIDIALNRHYLILAKDIADASKNEFAKEYVSLLIDFYNLKSALRESRLEEKPSKDFYVQRGRFDRKDLRDEKSILEGFKKFGGEKIWGEAIDDFKKTGDFSLIEKTSDEYIFSFMKNKSFDIFSPASLFSYFTAHKNNAQIIKIIITGKQAGLSESQIRFTLRKLYI